ncbi:uncharacterized protein VP01_726g4 [Puccinia sorghi]|uniref:Uncharacterized protein n=1 Tax=Puccinia sorghi TaxID=27349 RepID=A0A0L6UD41_9BASI|nr:uncharacterized protein VP01_726g4 [Puccinia sorghi]
MKGLIITISVALIMGRAQGQTSPALSAPNQPPSTNGSVLSAGAAMPAGLSTSTPVAANTTATTTLKSTDTSGGQLTNGTLTALNDTAAPTTTTSSSSSTNGTTTTTSLIGNSDSFNATGSSIFIMDQDISWSHSANFSIVDQNGTVAYQITNQYANTTLAPKEFIVQDARSGEKKLRIDARVKACGFGQTYEADDGTNFILDPRAFLSDRWYIKDANSEYTFKRHALSLQGNILENERLVAQVTAQNNSTSSSSSKKQLTIMSDGTIRPWDLIALIAVATTRIRQCGY